MATEHQLDAYGSKNTVRTTEHTMNPTDNSNDDSVKERVEITSTWFNLKIEDVNTPVLILVAMILASVVSITWIIYG